MESYAEIFGNINYAEESDDYAEKMPARLCGNL